MLSKILNVSYLFNSNIAYIAFASSIVGLLYHKYYKGKLSLSYYKIDRHVLNYQTHTSLKYSVNHVDFYNMSQKYRTDNLPQNIVNSLDDFLENYIKKYTVDEKYFVINIKNYSIIYTINRNTNKTYLVANLSTIP